MIGNKLLPSFYIIEVQGDAVESVISGPYGINKISIASEEFASDLEAIASMQEALDFILSSVNLDIDSAKQVQEFNPEFFPTIPPIKLNERQLQQVEEGQEWVDDMQEELEGTNKSAVVLTRMFDSIGDFVETRREIKSDKFEVTGRILVNTEAYMQHKCVEDANKKSVVPSTPILYIH